MSQRIVCIFQWSSVSTLIKLSLLNCGRSRRNGTFRTSPMKPLRSRSHACGLSRWYAVRCFYTHIRTQFTIQRTRSSYTRLPHSSEVRWRKKPRPLKGMWTPFGGLLSTARNHRRRHAETASAAGECVVPYTARNFERYSPPTWGLQSYEQTLSDIERQFANSECAVLIVLRTDV